MNCSEYEKILSAYTDSELTPEQHNILEEHLTGCPRCREKLAAYCLVSAKLSAFKVVPSSPDMRAAVMSEIKTGRLPGKKPDTLTKGILVAVPVMAVLLVLLLVQPWTLLNNTESVMAKAYSAIAGVRSYRLDIMKTGDTEEQNYQSEVEFTEPDRYHITETGNEGNQEFILIGDDQYYKGEFKSTIDLNALISTYSSMITRESTLNWLDTLKDIRQLPDEIIDGTSCYRYQGDYDYLKSLQQQQERQAERGIQPVSDEKLAEMAAQLETSMPRTIELWIGKDDYLIRKMNIDMRVDTNGQAVSSVIGYHFFDFNQPVTIEAPLDASGNLLPDWFSTAAPESAFSSNIQTSVDNTDRQNRMIIYNVTLANISGQPLTHIDIKIIPVLNNPGTGNIWTSWTGGFTGQEPYSLQPDESVNYKITYGYDATEITPETVAGFIENSGLSISYIAAGGQQTEETVRFAVPESIYTLPADLLPAIDLTPIGEYRITEKGASSAGQGVSGEIDGKEYLFVQVNTQNSDIVAEPGILILDTNDKAKPVRVSYISAPEGAWYMMGIALSDNVLYVATHDFLWILDVSDPATPRELTRFSEFHAVNLVISGRYAYVNDSNQRIITLDISDPLHPVILSSLPLVDPSGMSLNIAGNYLLAWVQDTLYTIDISSPASLKIVNSYPFFFPASPTNMSSLNDKVTGHIMSAAFDGNYAYVNLGSEAGDWMLVLDITDPSYPHETAFFEFKNRQLTGSVFTSGDRVYLFTQSNTGVDRRNKLSIIDVSVPSSPQEISAGTMPDFWSFFDNVQSSSTQCYNLFDTFLYWFIGNPPNDPVIEIIDLSGL